MTSTIGQIQAKLWLAEQCINRKLYEAAAKWEEEALACMLERSKLPSEQRTNQLYDKEEAVDE